ncbi:MAG: hypothetical protein JXB39_02890 [Deltaproteobacteria bacterium]|nr:hypothetical protein [Deltaproteobacteria bacterium]
MSLRTRARRWSGLPFLLGLVAGPSWAGVPFALPSSEDPSEWRGALALAATLDPAAVRTATGPWVEIQDTARLETWRLRVRDTAGVLHEVEVQRPSDDRGREDVVALAASLLHPVRSVSSPFEPRSIPISSRPVPEPPVPAREPARRLAVPLAPAEPPVEPPAPLLPAEVPLGPAESGEILRPPETEPLPVAASTAVTDPTALTSPGSATGAPPLAHPWMSAGGTVDLRADTGTSLGGEVLVGVGFHSGIHAGIGAASGTRHDLATLARIEGAAYQDTDLFGAFWWAPQASLAPLVGLKAGGTWRTFWLHDDRVEVTNDDGSPGVAARVLVASLEAGLAVRLVPGLVLVPAVRLRGDLPGRGPTGITPPSCIRWQGSDPSACSEGDGSYLSTLSLGFTLSVVMEPAPGDPDGPLAAQQGR